MMIQKIALIVTVCIMGLLILMAVTNSDTEQQVPNLEATSLTGTIVDSTTREGIPQAQVTLEEEGESTSTDEYGTFYFNEVEVGTHSISVEAVNYRPAQERVEVTEEGASIEIQLDPEYE